MDSYEVCNTYGLSFDPPNLKKFITDLIRTAMSINSPECLLFQY